MTNFSVVIPVLDEELIIPELVRRVENAISKLDSKYEIIIIDDGSVDRTWNEIKKITEKNERIKALRLSRNFGQHYAISAGLENAKGEWVIVMDGDLQDRPEVFQDLYAQAIKGFEVVFVSRTNRPESFVYRMIQKLFYFILVKLSGVKFDNTLANFSIINRKVVESFNRFPENARFYATTIKWLGYKATTINADHGTRVGGSTSYTYRKRINLAFDIIFAFSNRPLKFAITLGLFTTFISTIMGIWVIFTAINYGYDQLGWASVIAAILFTGGTILCVIGILGIYIGRIFNEVKGRPLYIVQQKINI